MRCGGFTVKGLEAVAADELADVVPTATVVAAGTKIVRFEVGRALRSLARLRCFDDVAVETMTSTTGEQLEDDDVASAVASAREVVEGLRPVGDEVSITVSAVGRPRQEVEMLRDRVLGIACKVTGFRLKEEGRSTFDLRLQIDAEATFLGVRLFDRPLAALRPPRVAHRRGGLRPTIAAAMVRIAAAGSRDRPIVVWDPFCGSGTILFEAAMAGSPVLGSDIDPEAVDVAVRNLDTLRNDISKEVVVADALRSPLWSRPRRGTCLVTNLPWDKQIAIVRRTDFYRTVGERLAMLAERGRGFVVLTRDPDTLLAAAGRHGLGVEVARRRLGFAGQTPTLLSVGQGVETPGIDRSSP